MGGKKTKDKVKVIKDKKYFKGGRIYKNFNQIDMDELQWKRMEFVHTYDNKGEQVCIQTDVNIDMESYIKNFVLTNSTFFKSGRVDITPVYLGCDSQVYGRYTVYSIAIGLRYVGGRGTHLVKSTFTLHTPKAKADETEKEKNARIKQRLLYETYATVAIALKLEHYLVGSGWMKEVGLSNLVQNGDTYYLPPVIGKNGIPVKYTNFVITAIDLNRDEFDKETGKENKSNAALEESEGYLKGLNFLVYAKPLSTIASAAADRLC